MFEVENQNLQNDQINIVIEASFYMVVGHSYYNTTPPILQILISSPWRHCPEKGDVKQSGYYHLENFTDMFMKLPQVKFDMTIT